MGKKFEPLTWTEGANYPEHDRDNDTAFVKIIYLELNNEVYVKLSPLIYD